MGFGPILQQIKTALETDAGLLSFVAAKWKKQLTVKITWRNRESIAASDLPLIMITRPSVDRGRNYGKVTGKHRVRIYAGFYQPQKDLRQLELLEFEEQILAALENSTGLAALIDGMSPADGANDEGALGDLCFTVQEIEIDTRG